MNLYTNFFREHQYSLSTCDVTTINGTAVRCLGTAWDTGASDRVKSALNRILDEPPTAEEREEAVQQRFNDAMSGLKAKRGVVDTPFFVDTHHSTYLDGLAPDLSFLSSEVPSLDTVVALGELCLSIDDEHMGKMMMYLATVLASQPHRAGIGGFLSNGLETQVWVAVRAAGGLKYRRTHSFAWSECKDVIARILCSPVAVLAAETTSGEMRVTLSSYMAAGATSSVYFGDEGRDLVYKVYKTDHAERALSERAILSALGKAEVLGVPMLAAGEWRTCGVGCPVIAMRYHGAPAKWESLTVERLRELAEVLRGVHSEGYVHRDIRCPNIVIDGESGALTLVDWGFAQHEGDTAWRNGSFITAPAALISLLSGGDVYRCSWKDDAESLCRLGCVSAYPRLRDALVMAEDDLKQKRGDPVKACRRWRAMWASTDLFDVSVMEEACGRLRVDEFAEDEFLEYFDKLLARVQHFLPASRAVWEDSD